MALAITKYFDPSTMLATAPAESLSGVVVKNENSGTGGPSSTAAQPARTYTVKAGDNLSEIAASYSLSNETVLAANQSIPNSGVIHPGDVLTIPSSSISDDEAAKIRKQRSSSAKTATTKVAAVQNATAKAPTTDGSYLVPVSYTYESQGFSSYHPGIDMVASLGTPIYATKAGCIISAGGGWNGGYGTLVTQDLGNGYSARYAHLTRIGTGITEGACIDQGAVIGYVGSTGNSTGPHLHFELRLNGVAFNPKL